MMIWSNQAPRGPPSNKGNTQGQLEMLISDLITYHALPCTPENSYFESKVMEVDGSDEFPDFISGGRNLLQVPFRRFFCVSSDHLGAGTATERCGLSL